ncbi:P-loop containing nucleoside triphosphatehydrolases superfamily protein [Striga asiatica]|uniref:P-loop containing nucleoside triphosphatehydrolases superfamily protein n=1 Tax=Striga asiatica TaxID=4170 RepID=A0A5A7PPQ4_STRAF|nr:P-loop containing nucleoside triphosphatehydrolases superfamily protein [Striga asiatica]
MTLFLFFRSLSSRAARKLPEAPVQTNEEFSFETGPKEELRPPSPMRSFTEAEVLSTVMKKLGELEEKVGLLESRPSAMPCEKEELLNAAVYRVDALEAELIATKKILAMFSRADIKGLPYRAVEFHRRRCGDEHIIIFMTNHKEKLDPALLRPGRMDVHIHMSYCTSCGFQLLAKNYLHLLMPKAESLIASTKVTPVEVGEQLLKCDDPTNSLEGLIKFIEQQKLNLDVTNGVESNLETGLGFDGLNRILKKAKEAPEEMSKRILKKDEAANALKILIEFLEEIGAKIVVRVSNLLLRLSWNLVNKMRSKLKCEMRMVRFWF